MQIIGFNFTKIAVERSANLKPDASANTDIEFSNIDKEKLDIIPDHEALKFIFRFSVSYMNQTTKETKDAPIEGSVVCEGSLIIAANKDESKEIFKSWKKKEIPSALRLPLYNIILKKCSVKALDLEEQLGLPPHIPFPTLQPKHNE